MKIKAFHARNQVNNGELPTQLIGEGVAEAWWGRDPFEDNSGLPGISANLLMAPQGTTDGHNTVLDSTFMDSIRLDKYVPVSPLFVRDLCGRTIYIGFGPERKGNAEWLDYRPPMHQDGTIDEDVYNPFVPMVVFPRFCRDVEAMQGKELLEQVFLTKFRSLEMSMGYNGQVSGAGPNDPLLAATYLGANLYPYKLRLDTYYVDGYKLPQTQMVFAKGERHGINPKTAEVLADQVMASWRERKMDADYVSWLEGQGEDFAERLYAGGCTLIPTFEACNGYHVVGPNFELEDYWPGRAVLGLHDVVEQRGDKAPQGTILEVLEPGYVTGRMVRPAKVIVSDGSGYVSPNALDPAPLVPNLNLPHTRTLDDWRATWVPTHPEHFEAPALWGWDLNAGRFMQLSGPLWDPLHYYYASVDKVLGAFAATPLTEARPLVPVPEEMEHRFFPVVPMLGFDTFSDGEFKRRAQAGLKPLCSVRRVENGEYSAGIGYHPLPAEYEFELDPFWFPEMHPLNREQGMTPADVENRICPVIDPKVPISMFVPTVDAPDVAKWLTDESLLFTQRPDPLENYTQLTRYLVPDMDMVAIMRLCPMPFLSEPESAVIAEDEASLLELPPPAWWLDNQGEQLDGPLALQELNAQVHDALWDMRQVGIDVVRFRHMVYRTNLPMYIMAWWYGWGVKQLELAMEDWLQRENEPLLSEDELAALRMAAEQG